jgi:hypothetical protein
VFFVTSKENFTRLMTIFFFCYIYSKYRKEQFKVWLETYNKQYNMNITFRDRLVIPRLHSGCILGYTDACHTTYARGCFSGRVKICLRSKLKIAPHLTFQISQKEFYLCKARLLVLLCAQRSTKKNPAGHISMRRLCFTAFCLYKWKQ